MIHDYILLSMLGLSNLLSHHGLVPLDEVMKNRKWISLAATMVLLDWAFYTSL